MTRARHCYQCGKSHPEEEMLLIVTKAGRRWRCVRTIQASRKPEKERDKFGEMIRAINVEITSATKRRRATYEL
jgi:hypothetical protein